MSTLVLSDDELALLRYTGDLFFVDESPLVAVERFAREPADYARCYQAMIDRGVIDEVAFRITDDALNRIAPVTECDARIAFLSVDAAGVVRQEDHWLLEEIAVAYERHEDGDVVSHVFGPDRDPHQLVQHFGRALSARRSGGDRFDQVLTSVEMLAVVLLLDACRRLDRRVLSVDEARAAVAAVAADDGVAGSVPGGLHAAATRLAAVSKAPLPRARLSAGVGAMNTGPRSAPPREDPLATLQQKGALLDDARGLRVHQTLFALAGAGRARHTFVRTDFRDDDWLVREVTLIPVEGSLVVIAPTKGGFRVAEVDGDALFDVLREATGPQGSGDKAPEPQRLAALLAGQPRRA